MGTQVYISLAGNDRLLHFTLDETSGQLSQIGSYDVLGRPAPLAMNPSNRMLYVGCRDTCELAS
jgi:6-phosphogluconolactonase (cycloisomerase 2 family)